MSGEEAAHLVASWIAALDPLHERPPLIGLNGAQASGKTTLARTVSELLAREHEVSCLVLALDDFYLTRRERHDLAARVHPLCATRGVPGTHDVALMRRTIARLATAGPDDRTPLPRFDKLSDDRLPESDWPAHQGRPDRVLLEGWCIDIRRADLAQWHSPINTLEAEHDRNGAWHAWSRAALAGYEPLWDTLDLLVSIEAPGWQTVIESRLEQERGLSRQSGRSGMDRAAIVRFVEHYERYTRAGWRAMPARADVLLRRDEHFRFTLASKPYVPPPDRPCANGQHA